MIIILDVVHCPEVFKHMFWEVDLFPFNRYSSSVKVNKENFLIKKIQSQQDNENCSPLIGGVKLHQIGNRNNRVKKLCTIYSQYTYFVSLYKFRAYLGPSSGGTTVCIQQLVVVIPFR